MSSDLQLECIIFSQVINQYTEYLFMITYTINTSQNQFYNPLQNLMQRANEDNAVPAANNNNNRREQQSRNRQFTLIIMLYLMITLFTHMSRTPQTTIKDIIRKKMDSTNTQRVPSQIFSAMGLQVYEGTWFSKPDSYAQYLTETQGKMKMACQVKKQIHNGSLYHFGFKVFNGQYADQGTINFQIHINSTDLIIIQDNDIQGKLKRVSLQLKNSTTSLAFIRYFYQRLLVGSVTNTSFLNDFHVNFTVLEERQVSFTFALNIQNPIEIKQFQQLRDQRYQKYYVNAQKINQQQKKAQQNTQINKSQEKTSQNKEKPAIQNEAKIQKKQIEATVKKEQVKTVVKNDIQNNKQIALVQKDKQSVAVAQLSKDSVSVQPSQRLIQQQALQPEISYNMQMQVKQELDILIPTVTFAAVMFFISYSQFTSIIEINRQMIEGTRDAGHFSFYTWLIAMGWDIIFCFCCFNQAFSSTQTGIILFIMPAFLFALIFMNMEPKIMIFTYRAQTDSNLDFRQLLCRFNLYNYAVLFLTFGVILLTNFNNFLPISLCLIFVPQIYLNGINGQRPEISDPYYSKFLLSRFAIIFYLRGFPWNLYDLKPDYLLCLTCAALLLFQISILWVQKAFGPKTVIPSFLLPPVYNYNCDEDLQNIEQAGEVSECTICLIPLTQFVEQSQNDLGYQVPHKVMKTPCNHKYHGLCLVQWMKIKMECPQCRTRLPPYQ